MSSDLAVSHGPEDLYSPPPSHDALAANLDMAAPSTSAAAATAIESVEDEAYQPTYSEAFPPLPSPSPVSIGQTDGGGQRDHAQPPATQNKWNSKMSMRSTTLTQVFCVPLEERRYKEMTENQFGEKGGPQAKICMDIMTRTGVAIEMSLARDLSLTVVITGKSDSVLKARKMVVQQLHTQARVTIPIPKEHHRFILGQKGKKLTDLELATATKISIPRTEENSSTITISGTKEGIEKARHEIQTISDEQAKLAFERLPISHKYHPFISGPEGQNVKQLIEQTGARINVPPPPMMKDEIVIAGEKDGVFQAKQTIMMIYEEKKRKCQTVSVEVRKSQHKYVIGPRGSNIAEILAQTGVSVEVPFDGTSETITLRGEQDKLGPALTLVYSKANSVVIEEVQAPAWLHRFIIGRKGVNVRKVTQDLPKVHIEFTEGQNKILLEGPPEEVALAKAQLQEITQDWLSRMAFAEIEVDQKYHRHIIGKSGANVTRIKNEMGVSIRIPSDREDSNIIRIEGSPEGVARAKQELLDMVQKMENEKSRDIIIEHRFHKALIGAQGSKIREIRDKFNDVQVTFPDANRKNDVVTVRGPKNDVDKCYKYLQQMLLEMVANNFMAEVHIFKQFHKNIIGRGGANIRKIRDETDTRIDLPSENSESDVIAITGKKENVLKAKEKIEAIQKELANIKEVTIDIPHKFHNSMIGAKGRLIRAIMDECGGVIIRFPPEGAASNNIVVRGPTDDVEKARKQLLDLASERKEQSHTCEVHAKPEYHKFLIGRGGTNIRDVRTRTGARVIFPSQQDNDQELITIMGTQDCVDKAKKELESQIKELDNVIESTITVDPKHHRHFVARRGEVLRTIADDFGGVTVSFPRSGVKSDKVVLKGSKDCVDAAKKRILEIVDDLEAQVTIECVIPQKFHRTVMGAKGYKVQEITRDFEVGIKFPDRPAPAENAAPVEKEAEEGAGGEVNGDSIPDANADTNADTNADANANADEVEKLTKKEDIIIITGKKEHCEGARDALQELVPVTLEVNVPFDYHRFIIGQKGRDVRKMMDEFDVNISIPPADNKSDVVKITGPRSNVTRAEEGLNARVKLLESEQEERKLRNFQMECQVDSCYHPKIIGRRGAVISKIREEYDVNIQFPEKGSERSDVITITGYEDKAHAASDAILKIVHELEDMISEEVQLDHRIHSRIIGGRGRGIRKIMDDYKVDIKFPTRESSDPDLVVITGAEDQVLDCKDQLLNLEEEFLQDVNEKELMKQYLAPTRGNEGRQHRPPDPGFVVRDAPWNAPDTSSVTDFPEFPGSSSSVTATPIQWGPPTTRRK